MYKEENSDKLAFFPTLTVGQIIQTCWSHDQLKFFSSLKGLFVFVIPSLCLFVRVQGRTATWYLLTLCKQQEKYNISGGKITWLKKISCPLPLHLREVVARTELTVLDKIIWFRRVIICFPRIKNFGAKER